MIPKIFPLHSKWLNAESVSEEERSVLKTDRRSGSEHSLDYLLGDHSSTLLVIKEDSVLQTCLLFQAAVSLAHEGRHVVFICRQPFSQMPLVVHGMPRPEAPIMTHIKMIYLRSSDELVSYLASIHELAVLPDDLIIDDIHHFGKSAEEDATHHSFARLYALLIDTVSYLNQIKDEQCHMLVAVRGHNQDMYLYQRFFKQIFSLRKSTDFEESRDFVLEECIQPKNFSRTRGPLKLHYAAHNEQIYLRSVEKKRHTDQKSNS